MIDRPVLASVVLLMFLSEPTAIASEREAPADLWNLAKAKAPVHRFSTTVKAQEIRDLLTNQAGVDAAIDWCRKTGVTKVYLETFRYAYLVERPLLERAKASFRAAGFEVSGCVTPTNIGKNSTGWNVVCCYTDLPTQKRLQEIFEYTAGLFDEIMIDDFWFTDCMCSACDAARRSKTVTVGEQTWPTASDSWKDYRCELLLRLSRARILEPARRVNPKVRIIVKYPCWYDDYQERGYDVIRETAEFDRTWVGTETRDYESRQWGGTPQYAGYFLMRWLGGIGGAKCGGAWYDPLCTTEKTYLEQARQTVLAGARESLLHSYGYLLKGHIEKSAVAGPKDIAALRPQIPELLTVAEEVSRRKILGMAAYKPAHSSGESERRVFDFVGMGGLPLVPCHEFPADARAAFFSLHALKDPDLAGKLAAFIAAGKRVLVTDGLAKRLAGKVDLAAANVQVLRVEGSPKSLLGLSEAKLNALRAPLLQALGHEFRAPNRVGLYLFDDRSWVIENFNDEPVAVTLDGAAYTLPPRQWRHHWVPPGTPAAPK
jgi:hypothetical protein